MRAIDLLISCLTKKYATFSGRASRKELLVWIFFEIVLMFLVGGFYGYYNFLTSPNASALFLVIVLVVPGFAVTIRRLHDINRSGWYCLPFVFEPTYLFISNITGLMSYSIFNPESLSIIFKTLWYFFEGLLGGVLLLTNLIVFIFCVQKGTRGNNRFGADPLIEQVREIIRKAAEGDADAPSDPTKQ